MNLKLLRSTAWMSLAFLFLSVSVRAESNVLQVKCVDEAGKALEKVKVYLQPLTESKFKDENSNREGIATFKKLKDGYYRVFAHQEGYASTFYEFIHLSGGATESCTLNFVQGNPEKKLYFEDQQIFARANQLLQEGAQLLQASQFDEAGKKIEESISINPSEPMAYYNLAIFRASQGEWDLAAEEFKKTLSLFEVFMSMQGNANPALEQQYNQVKSLLESLPIRRLAAEIADLLREAKWEEAHKKIVELKQHEPNSPSVYYNEAIALSRMERLEEAEKAIDKALELDPNDEPSKDFKARFEQIRENAKLQREQNLVQEVQDLRKEEKHAEAIAKAEEAMGQVDKKYHAALIGEAAQSHLALEQFDQALDAFQKYYELNNTAVDQGLFDLGQNLNKRGKQAAAKSAFEKVLSINPEFAEVYYELGMEYFYGTQEKERAKSMLEKYIDLGKDADHLSNAKNVLTVIEKTP